MTVKSESNSLGRWFIAPRPSASWSGQTIRWLRRDRAISLVFVEYAPLLKAGLVSLFIHHDAADPADARATVDGALTSAGLGDHAAAIGWVTHVRPETRPSPRGCCPPTRRARRSARRFATLGLPTVSNRYEAEELCVTNGVMEASVERAFCPQPWWHLYVGTTGIAHPCCIALPSEAPSLADSPLPAVYNNAGMRRLRLRMLNGVRDPMCRVCWEKEDAGAGTFREQALKHTTEFSNAPAKSTTELVAAARSITTEDGSIPDEKVAPISIDIRWSNLCNFKCRMCNHAFSSLWFDEAKQIANDMVASGRNPNARRLLVHGDKAVITLNEDHQALARLTPHLQNLSYVYSAGGEPLMMEEHFELLEALKPRASEVGLGYNTNLSRLDYRGRDHPDLVSLQERRPRYLVRWDRTCRRVREDRLPDGSLPRAPAADPLLDEAARPSSGTTCRSPSRRTTSFTSLTSSVRSSRTAWSTDRTSCS